MSLVVLGTNHQSAKLEIRERWSYGINEVPAALKKISKNLAINEVVLLSTCNRTEIYCDIENADDLINWFNQEIKPLTSIDLNEHGYLYQNQHAVMHLMRVASGLDSMVIGEPQILGQFKQAYRLAKDAKTIGRKFDKLFDQVFTVAKTVRANTDIGLHPLSVACASVNLLLTGLDSNSLPDLQVLLIGSGDTIKIIAKTLINKNIKNIHIVSRTKEHAVALADYLHTYTKENTVKVYDFNFIENMESSNFDVVFSATQSSDYILNYDAVAKIVPQDKNKKLLLMDLAVPRDIDPKCSDLEQICLYTIDDLQLILQNNTQERQKSVLDAEGIIKQHANDFFAWEQSLLVLSSICQYRQQADAMCNDVISIAQRKLEAGQDPQEVLINALELLRNKLLHHPTVTLKSLAEQQKISEVELLKDFLNINNKATVSIGFNYDTFLNPMNKSIESKLRAIAERYDELSHLLSVVEVINNQEKFREYSKEYAQLQDIVNCFVKWQKAVDEQAQAQQLQEELNKKSSEQNSDEMAELAELKELTQEDLNQIANIIASLEHELQLLLLPTDPNDERNVFLEIRAGTGGDEASIFVGDLYKMYTKYGEKQGWTIEILNTSDGEHGGYKEIIMRISGKSVYSQLKYESGAHRVQRVPVTESQGRIHTSACTVAVLPEADEIEEIDINPADLRIDTYRSSGAGGQHVNKTESAIRITHLPSGLVVECQDERSQHKNRARALSLLQARLFEQVQTAQRQSEAATRKSLVGTGDRSERIRTYNYPQGRVTDHRINLTLYKIDQVMEGELDLIIKPLVQEYQAEQLALISSND